jgi:hypothetical protein
LYVPPIFRPKLSLTLESPTDWEDIVEMVTLYVLNKSDPLGPNPVKSLIPYLFTPTEVPDKPKRVNTG